MNITLMGKTLTISLVKESGDYYPFKSKFKAVWCWFVDHKFMIGLFVTPNYPQCSFCHHIDFPDSYTGSKVEYN